MKITMIALGSTGDVRPFILLGKELSSRGHAITIAAFSRFARDVSEAGFRFFPLCGDAESFISRVMQPGSNALTYLPHVERELKHVAPLLISDLCQSCEDTDALICNFFGSVYYSIAEKYNIPCIQTYYFPMDPNREIPMSTFRNQRMAPWMNLASYKMGYFLLGTAEKHFLNTWRKENSLSLRKPDTAPDYRIGSHIVPVVYAISPQFIPRPKEWNEHIYMSGFWFDDHPEPWSPPESLQQFLSSGSQPVYIGFGSMKNKYVSRLLTVVLRALHATGIRAVIATGWNGRNLKSTRQVYFIDYIPHDWLFPKVLAVVHHGGAGTTAAGLRYGRPTLILPFGGDQSFWGYHIHRSGCGPRPIPCQRVSVENLTKALLKLVGKPEYRLTAEKLGEAIRQENGTCRAADLIEKEITGW